jgi:hypothetical protein
MEPLSLVNPTFNEAKTIGAVIRYSPAAYRLDMIFANGGSTDGTRRTAPAAGVRAVSLPACATGMRCARAGGATGYAR